MDNAKETEKHCIVDICINDTPELSPGECMFPGIEMISDHKETASMLRKANLWWMFICLFSLVSIVVFGTALIVKPYMLVSAKMDRVVDGRYNKLQLSPFSVRRGLDLGNVDLIGHLEAAGYSRSVSDDVGEMQYFSQAGQLYLRGDKNYSDVTLHVEDGKVVRIEDSVTGQFMDEYTLPPQTFTSYIDSVWEQREPLRFEDIPEPLIDAIIAAEDHRFFNHIGIDVRGIARAAWKNLKSGRVIQGGSTITQQLVKVLNGRTTRGWSEKFIETGMAVILDFFYSKEEILTAYCNMVYMGYVNRFKIHGVGAAARLILGKSLDSCTTSEYAALAGLIRSPNKVSPLRNPDKAIKRVKTVLQQMGVKDYTISKTIVSSIHQDHSQHDQLKAVGYYLARLEKELAELPAIAGKNTVGFTIDLSLDLQLQKNVTENLARHLRSLEKRRGLPLGTLQGAVIVTDPETGAVLACAGGRDYWKSQYDRVFASKRQIGSLVKPFVYLVGLGPQGLQGNITQADIILDTPIKVKYDNTSWQPKNYDLKFLGPITVREALAKSRNIPAVRVGLNNGLDRVADLLQLLNISPTPDRRPAMLLGACSSSPASMASAFSVFANGGQRVQAHLVRKVSADGKTYWQEKAAEPVLAPSSCYVMTDMLRAVITDGSGKGARKLAEKVQIAGKTGTSSKKRDAWFTGYTSDTVTTVWVGRDDNKPTGLTGASGALPLWREIMTSYLARKPSPSFKIPPGVVFINIDKKTGKPVVDQKDSEQQAFLRTPQMYVRNSG